MASETGRTSALFRSIRRSVAATSACAVVFSGVVIGAQGFGTSTAYAVPNTVAEAKAALEKIEAESSAIEERYAASQDKLDKSQKLKTQASTDLVAQTKKVESARATLGQVAITSQQSNGLNVTLRMLSSQSDEDFLSQMATMQSVSSLTAERMARFNSEKTRLSEMQSALDASIATIQAETQEQKKLLKQYEAKEAEAKAILNRLTAEDRARLDAARAAQVQTQANNSTKNGAQQANPPVAVGTAPSERAAGAVAYAMAQRGKPYIFGGTGPGGYDCSGLMMAAYRSVGVSIPRTSTAQFGVGTPVSANNLQPGDLVFYYSHLGHVGMYIGNGMVIHASTPGTGIIVAGVFTMPFSGARRVA